MGERQLDEALRDLADAITDVAPAQTLRLTQYTVTAVSGTAYTANSLVMPSLKLPSPPVVGDKVAVLIVNNSPLIIGVVQT